MKLFVVLVVAALVGLSAAQQKLKFMNCLKNKASTVHEVTVTPCSSFPCLMNIYTTYSIAMNVTFNQDVTYGKASLKAKLGAILVPLTPFNGSEMCDFVQGGCPIKAGQTVRYTTPLVVPKDATYPIIPKTLEFEWQAADKESKMFLCFLSEISIDHHTKNLRRSINVV